MISLGIPYLEYVYISEKAMAFLKEHDALTTVPVDIETIIEFQLDMDIIPMPNLQRDFQTEGFTSSDFSSIYVDESIYSNVPVRYRFTLAHEVAHWVLHKEYLGQVDVNSVADWKQFVDQVGEAEYSMMEYQGYCFAGLVLVPPDHLSRHFDEHLPDVQGAIETAKREGFQRRDYLDSAKEMMATKLAPLFDVSRGVIIRRIGYDELDQRFS